MGPPRGPQGAPLTWQKAGRGPHRGPQGAPLARQKEERGPPKGVGLCMHAGVGCMKR